MLDIDINTESVLSWLGFFLLVFEIIPLSFRRPEWSLDHDKAASKFSELPFVPQRFFLEILSEEKHKYERPQTAFVSLYAGASSSNLCILSRLFTAHTHLFQRTPLDTTYTHYLQPQPEPNPIHPKSQQPRSHLPLHPRTLPKPPKMHPPSLNIPNPTYQPNPPPPNNNNDYSDVEQQAPTNIPNPNPSNAVLVPNGQNSVRARVFSGLLMLVVIAIIVMALVLTSVKLGKGH